MSRPPPHKRAKKGREDIQRAEYTTSRSSRRGVRAVEKAAPFTPQAVLQPAADNPDDMMGVNFDDHLVEDEHEGHDIIPNLDEIWASWGKVRGILGDWLHALIRKRTKMYI